MKTIEYLTDPLFMPIFWPGVLAGVAMALLSAGLSVFVVVKRLSFIGQGISHAAFGGAGLAAIMALSAVFVQGGLRPAPFYGIPQFLIITLFCLAAGLLVGVLSDKEAAREDSTIGIILVASMALGAILIKSAPPGPTWESLLFGSLYAVYPQDAAIAWALAAGVLLSLWLARRSLIFWSFDESASPAFGVSPRAMKFALLALLAITTVASMKLAGVVLATAMLIFPGAIALQLSTRLVPVFVTSFAVALVGVLAGIVLSFELDWSPGPAIVVVLTCGFLVAKGVRLVRGRQGTHGLSKT